MHEFHPLANVLPLTEGAEFDRLVADIAEHGLHNPITLLDGLVLEGRNRERACPAAGVEPRYVEFEGKDPAAYVLSQNLIRPPWTVRAGNGGRALGQPEMGPAC